MRSVNKIFSEKILREVYNLYLVINDIQIHVSYKHYSNLLYAGLSSDGAVSRVIQLRAGSIPGRYKTFIQNILPGSVPLSKPSQPKLSFILIPGVPSPGVKQSVVKLSTYLYKASGLSKSTTVLTFTSPPPRTPSWCENK